MNRRSFLETPLAAGLVAAGAAADAPERKTPDVFELRSYTVRPGKQETLDGYLSKALIPAARRLGLGPVGVFTDQAAANKVYVLLVHPSGDSVVTLPARLAADATYAKAAHDYLAAPATDPVYSRVESSILIGIEGMPKLEKPDTTRSRILNLRIYESHNERAGNKKVEMFNKGELDIFRRVGLTPVLFGQAIAGALMPNLTYMLVFPDDAGRKAAWSRFVADPAWLKLRAIPAYADKEIVSRITNLLLTPAAYSEI
ncbi:MAG: NIPSNAP family protein [Gemmataceae bacterium]